jgi:hypothetical protein
MTSTPKNSDLLSSWKEIAAYLGVDERTCNRWEKNLGLPVHRLEGSSRSRVFAYKEEIDRWRKERLSNDAFPAIETRQEFKRPKSYFLALILIVIFGVILFILFSKLLAPSQPTDFRIEGSYFIVFNNEGKELWRYPTGKDNLVDEKIYRSRFQVKKLSEAGQLLLPYVIMKDINRDKNVEVLYTNKTQDELGEGELFCFSHKGKLLWKFSGGREMKFDQQVFSADYRIIGFDLDDLDGDGNLEIIGIAIQIRQWPCQLALLNNKGEVLGEFWNSGYLVNFLTLDLNQDGKKEIVAAGSNNEYGKACLVVFDAAHLAGSSPQLDDHYRFQGLPSGLELYYILLPRIDVDLAENYPVDGICRLDIVKGNRILVETGLSHIFFVFDYDFVLQGSPQSSHIFEQKHRRASLEGKLKSVLNNEYWKNLARGVLYWDGKNWSSAPTMNGNSALLKK